MSRRIRLALGTLLLAGAGLGTSLAGPALSIVAVEPAAGSRNSPTDTPIVIHFDRPVATASVTDDENLWAFARWSGTVSGSYSFSNGDTTVTLTPGQPFSAGESVMVLLSKVIEGQDGSSLPAGYSYQFWTRARPAAADFAEIDRMPTRTVPAQATQAYGGIASDLNGDGWLDITIVNEITADLRVFLNKADGTGLFHAFIQPTFPVRDRASPSEPTDFNRDGHVDICVANIDDNSVSVLLGNGDGTFGPQQVIPVGVAPRGIAVLDVDGDADLDIVNTNSGSGTSNMTLMVNPGNGVFGPARFFAAGMGSPWALGAADMNADGIPDLVAGSRADAEIVVLTGDGTGFFTPSTPQNVGGAVWMLVCGDVNGDGTDDVATINSDNNSGAILFGDGAGGLGLPQLYSADPFGLATDLGDVNGDTWPDWITSSFSGNWRLNMNDGDGTFTFAREFIPTSTSSCSLALDIDNDGDLDLALIDEIADEVIVMQNSGIVALGSPPRVPDGGLSTLPLTVDKLDPAGVDLSVSWDATTCSEAVGYHLVYGGGTGLPADPGGTFSVTAGVCTIGSSPFVWSNSPDAAADPSGLLWWVVVADDAVSTEGSWGLDSASAERIGPGVDGVSGTCGMTDRDLANTCGP